MLITIECGKSTIRRARTGSALTEAEQNIVGKLLVTTFNG